MFNQLVKLAAFSLVVGSVLTSPAKLGGHHRQLVQQELVAPVAHNFGHQHQHQQNFGSEAAGRQLQEDGFDNGPSDIQEDIRDGPFWDGSYYFRYVTSDGTVREEGGQPAQDGTMIVTGSYAYPAPSGELIAMEYIADSQGYRAFPKGTNPEYVPPQRVTDPGLPANSGRSDLESDSGFGGGNLNQGTSLNVVSQGFNNQRGNAARSFNQQQNFDQHDFSDHHQSNSFNNNQFDRSFEFSRFSK